MRYPVVKVHKQLMKMASTYLVGHLDDVRIHDLQYLKDYKPKRFLWSIRRTGSNLVSLDTSFWADSNNVGIDKQNIRDFLLCWHIQQNEWFFLYENGTFKHISREEATNEIVRASA